MTVHQDIYDGAWKLFNHDAVTGRTVWMLREDDRTVFRVDMPLGAIFDANHEAEAATMGNRFGDYNRVASIPAHLMYTTGLNDAVGQKDSKWLSKWLNSSDNRKFRTSRGRV